MDVTRPRVRVGMWIGGTFLYLLAILGWVVWMKMPPKIEAPMAFLSFPDGTQLRLVHSAIGPSPGIGYRTTFGNRIRLRAGEGANFSHVSDPSNGGWLVLTRFAPDSEKFVDPPIQDLRIEEPGSPYSLISERMNASGVPYSVYRFRTIPRRTRELTLNYGDGSPAQKFTFENPFYSSGYTAFTPSKDATAQKQPAPPPQQLENGGFVARLEGVSFRQKSFSGNVTGQAAEPRLVVTCPNTKSNDFQVSREWFDPTGNCVQDGTLPWSEPIWGLRVKVKEGNTFPIPAERRIKLGDIPVPATGQVVSLKVPAEMKAEGVTDVIVVGAGGYTRTGRSFIGAATPGGAVVSQAQVKGYQHFGSFTASGWEIRILSQSKNKRTDFRSLLRVLKGDEVCQPSSTGRSTSNDEFHEENFGSFRLPKSGALQVGDPVTLEVILPKTYVFEFQIPRPEFVKKP